MISTDNQIVDVVSALDLPEDDDDNATA